MRAGRDGQLRSRAYAVGQHKSRNDVPPSRPPGADSCQDARPACSSMRRPSPPIVAEWDGTSTASSRRSGTPTPTFAVVCQRADAERFGRMAPEATIVAGPAAVAHRPARLAWEQTGLPLVAAQVNADVLHSPHYTMPLRAGRPVVVTIHDATFFTQPDVHTSIKGPFFRSAIKTALHRAARCVVPSKATRDELIRVLDADPTKHRRGLPRGRPEDLPRSPSDTEKALVNTRLGSARLGVHRLPRACSSRARTCRRWSAAGSRPWRTGPIRRRWCWPAAPAGTTRSTRRSPRCRATCGCCGRAT